MRRSWRGVSQGVQRKRRVGDQLPRLGGIFLRGLVEALFLGGRGFLGNQWVGFDLNSFFM